MTKEQALAEHLATAWEHEDAGRYRDAAKAYRAAAALCDRLADSSDEEAEQTEQTKKGRH